MSQATLSAERVQVAIGARTILREVSLQAGAGEFIGIIGPNGAGKSTLLRALRGILPAKGRIEICGQDLRGLSDKSAARLVAYMQQNVQVDFGFTALEVVLAGRYPHLKWWQSESGEDVAIARRYMAFTGVERLAGQSAASMSGGERQRVLLAKALAQETPLLFLDEPTANLDLTYQEEIFRHCRSLCQAESGAKLIVMVVHDIRLASKFCSRLILLADGGVVADGAPQEVVTAEHLYRAYGLRAVVFRNPISGALDFHAYKEPAQGAGARVFVLAAGGAGAPWMRGLYECGCDLSGGALKDGEIDATAAAVFGVDGEILPRAMKRTARHIAQARARQAACDWTLLPQLIYGPEELRLLELAQAARRLLVIEDEPIETRDFTGGRAAALYRSLLEDAGALRMTSRELSALLAAGRLPFAKDKDRAFEIGRETI